MDLVEGQAVSISTLTLSLGIKESLVILADAFDGTGRGLPKRIEEMGAINLIAHVPWRPTEQLDDFADRAHPILAEVASEVRSRRLTIGQPMMMAQRGPWAWRVERYRGIPLFGWLDSPIADVINFGLYTTASERRLTAYRAGGMARLYQVEKALKRPRVTVIEQTAAVQ